MDNSATEWQRKKYLDGFAGAYPTIPSDYKKLEALAREVMTPRAFAYVAGGAGNEDTVARNSEFFHHYNIMPRMLRDVEERDTTVTLFDSILPSPLLLSPVGVLELAHDDADIAVAKAASALGVPFIFSNQASVPMEQTMNVMKRSPRWFQLYWSKSPKLVESFLLRAERCKCEAIVVTLDTTLLGWRTRDVDMGYLPFLEGKGIAQYTSDAEFHRMMDNFQPPVQKKNVTYQSLMGLIKMVNRYPGEGFFRKLKSGRPVKAVQTFVATYSNPRTTWSDLKILRDITSLPIVLKGITHPDDARHALDEGMDGIIVSNHGGRQVDGAVSTLEALPGIASIVPKNFPVLLDGGVRGGADIFKALALGAKAVCIGRPYVYGLAVGGAEGVYQVLRNYMTDFELTMALAGCKNVSEITKECLLQTN
jgi:lactate 2-monooxygenase